MRLMDKLNQVSDRLLNNNFQFIYDWARSTYDAVIENTGDITTLEGDIVTISENIDTIEGDIDDIEAVLSPKCKFTAEGGLAIKMTNGSGGTVYKGELVAASTTADSQFIKQTNTYDSFGAVYDTSIGIGADGWVVISGIAQVLIENSPATPVTHGMICAGAGTDGRATAFTNPGGGLPGTDNHFRECGHFIESKDAGTDVLAYAVLHFN